MSFRTQKRQRGPALVVGSKSPTVARALRDAPNLMHREETEADQGDIAEGPGTIPHQSGKALRSPRRGAAWSHPGDAFRSMYDRDRFLDDFNDWDLIGC